MNYRHLARVFGALLLLISTAMFACALFGLVEALFGDSMGAARALGISGAITSIVGLGLFLAGKKGTELLRKEAVVVVGLGWFICSAFGMLPYILGTPSLPLAAAFFESVSGFTTTGSTVIVGLDTYPKALLLWRAVTQWLGGVGILVLFIALLSYFGTGGKSLFRVESSAGSRDGGSTRVQQTALKLLWVYLALTGIAFLGMKVLGMSWFDALCHAFTTAATGGFSTHDASFAYFDSAPLEYFAALIMLASGGVTFFFYTALLKRNWRRVKAEEEGRWFLTIIMVATLLIVFNLTVECQFHTDFWLSLRYTVFQVASIATTSGFASYDYDQWPAFSSSMLLVLMLIGGSSGSTAGGLKVVRIALFLKTVRQEVVAAFRPRRVYSITMNGKAAEDEARGAVFLVALIVACLCGGALLITLLEPHLDWGTSFSATFATLFNIGPGFSGVGPTETFAKFGSPALFSMSVFMIMGRLELLAVLALFVPALWKRY